MPVLVLSFRYKNGFYDNDTWYLLTYLCYTGLVHLKDRIFPKFNVKSPTFVVILYLTLKMRALNAASMKFANLVPYFLDSETGFKHTDIWQFEHACNDDTYCVSIWCINDTYCIDLDYIYRALAYRNLVLLVVICFWLEDF